MRSEPIAQEAFRVGEAYSRKDMARVGGVTPPVDSRDPFWSTGILEFENAIVLIVSLVKKTHEFSYRDYFSGSLFWWQSQNRNTQQSDVIQQMHDRSKPVLLFVRVHAKVKNVTQPFVYCGELSFLEMQGERPVTIKLQSLEYDLLGATPQLTEIYNWRPDKLADAGEVDRHDRIDVRQAFGQGRQSDAAVRRAIEAYGMSQALAHYEKLGYKVFDTSLNHPFDLECTLDDETRRVEVKATQSAGDEVLVTAGEVRAARDPNFLTDLYVVHSVSVSVGTSPSVSGGIVRIISEWRPTDADLVPTTYRCRVID